MSFNYAQIKSLLTTLGSSSLHRRVFILAGQVEWQKNILKDILLGYEDVSLWVGEDDTVDYPFVEVKKTTAWLGKEKQVVIFDSNKEFNPDSFAAISGVVVGGGLFFLLFPEQKQWHEVYATSFGQRLLQSINKHPELVVINQDDNTLSFTENAEKKDKAENYKTPFLTLDQQNSVEAIQKQIFENSGIPIVLVSDRGRGKSAALGIAAARLLESGVTNIVVTAPRLSATDIVFKHIAENLSGAEVTRGCVKAGEVTVQFYSPDHLLQEDIEADILLVDEAAAIPVPVLTRFLHKYSQCVFATTVHGYEGTGRGFSLRFYKELDKKSKNWLKLQMKTPIRWAENDPLENWMFDLLCLDADVLEADELSKVELNDVENYLLNKEQLNDNELLKEVFALLVLAHYRTRPKDLKSLLDDDNISVYVSLYNKNVIAVALVIREGGFPTSLSTEVYQGKRRPQGHLLAQALTYHCGVEQAATLDYARIMRVAVHPTLQQKGLGTALINFIVTSEKKLGRDAIGTSFGMNSHLLGFWKNLKFDVVRIGFTREQTSGEHAAIMLLSLNSEGEIVKQEAHAQFIAKLPFWFDDVLKDIPLEIKNSFQTDNQGGLGLNPSDEKDLYSFIHYSRNYELCILAINKYVMMKLGKIKKDSFPAGFHQVLTEKVMNKKSWDEIVCKMELSGKNEARKLFQRAVKSLSNIS